MPDVTEYLEVGDAAHELRCSTRWVHELERVGRLPIAARTRRGTKLWAPATVAKAARERMERTR
jgi:hypothetical protein